MTSIKYQSIKIEKIQESSGLFIGTNIQKGRIHERVVHEGFGTIRGKNLVKGNASVVKKS